MKKNAISSAAAPAAGIAPRKSLGQNFLKDVGMAKKIAGALSDSVALPLVEIGPGEGALTRLLLQMPFPSVTSVEIDSRAAALLREKFTREQFPRFRLVEGDFLSLAPDKYCDTSSSFAVIGNIPYYITSDILFTLFDLQGISKAVIMMQKEVAKRLVAPPRTKEYGILTVAASFAARTKILFHVPPGCFFPAPKVTSSVVEFSFRPFEERQKYNNIRELVRTVFQQRRKQLGNSIEPYLQSSLKKSWKDISDTNPSLNKYGTMRPEELTPEQFAILYDLLHTS